MFECRRLLLVAIAALAAIEGTAGSEAAVPVSTTYSANAPRLHVLVAKRSVGSGTADISGVAAAQESAQAAGLPERGREVLQKRQENIVGKSYDSAQAASRDRRRARLQRRQASTPTLIGEPRINVLLGKRDESSARLEKRQDEAALLTAPRINVLLGKRDESSAHLEKRQDEAALLTAPRINVLLGKRDEPSSRLEKRQDEAALLTAPRINVLLGKRDSVSRLQKRQTAAGAASGAAAGTATGAATGTATAGTATGTSTRAPAAAPTPKEGGVLSPIQFRPIALQLSMPFSVAGLVLTFLLFFLMFRGSAAIDDQARRAMQTSTVARGGKM